MALEDGLRLLPPAEVAEILERRVLQLRGELPPEAVPAEPRLSWYARGPVQGTKSTLSSAFSSPDVSGLAIHAYSVRR